MRIIRSPKKKAAVPLAFCLRAKKSKVFCGPMIIVRPMRKSICFREGPAASVSQIDGPGTRRRRVSYVSHSKPDRDGRKC